MSELPQTIIENGIQYSLIGDYYFPDFRDPDAHGSFGKWGDMHLNFLLMHHHNIYMAMLLTDTLIDYLESFNAQADERFQRIMEQLKGSEGITQKLKATDQMEWVSRMNRIHGIAE